MSFLLKRAAVSFKPVISGMRIGGARAMGSHAAAPKAAVPKDTDSVEEVLSGQKLTIDNDLLSTPAGLAAEDWAEAGKLSLNADGSWSAEINGTAVRVGWPASTSIEFVLKPPVEQHLFGESPAMKAPAVEGH